MTVFGIAGCTALLLTGFCVRDSIRAVLDRQYGDIFTYDITIGIEDDGVQSLSKYQEISDLNLLQREGGSLSNENGKKNISIVVPKDVDGISKIYPFKRFKD